MKERMMLVVFALVVLGGCFSLPTGSNAESLYGQIQRTVIRLEHASYTTGSTSVSTQQTNLEPISDGTAFFVGYKNDFILVTARHVVDRPYDTYARVPVMNIKTGEVTLFRLELPRYKWQFHRNGGDNETRYVDVAVMKISSLDQQKYILKCLRYNPHEPSQHDFLMHDILPPSDILVFGFPKKLGFEMKRQCPLGRMGLVAMTSDEKFVKMDGKYCPSKTLLIDSKMFPGNSGGPIVAYSAKEDRFKLAGLVIATNNEMEYAVAEPVVRIGETIDIIKDQSLDGHKFWCGPISEEDEKKIFWPCGELTSKSKAKIFRY